MTASPFSLTDFIQYLAYEDVTDTQIFNYLSCTNVDRLKQWLVRLDNVRSMTASGKAKQAQRSRLVGKILERAVRVLLDGCKGLAHAGNVRTTTSEVDFMIRIEPLGKVVAILREANTHAIGEAKCYSSAPKSEWITEFGGILDTHSATLGILFTACPPKKLRSEIRTSIALLAGKGKFIVPFGLTQFHRICAGENFLTVLSEQAVSSRTHSTALAI